MDRPAGYLLNATAPAAPSTWPHRALTTPRRRAGPIAASGDMVTLSQQFKKDTGIDIEYITLSGGDATARVQAEKDNPQADVVVGGSVDLYGSLKDAGALAAYDSPNNDDLDAMKACPF